MSGYLPYGEFKCLKNVDNLAVYSISENSPTGYILEADLQHPDALHVRHNDYPVAPQKLGIPYDMLSNHCKNITDKYGIKVADGMKLIPNLGDKINYALHCKNLLLYLSLGIKLKKIYKVLTFKQSNWMKKYIDFNTEKGTNVANSFKKNFLKLMINSVYGKTMENLRKKNQNQTSKQ